MNLPNKLCFLRLLFVPIILLVLYSGMENNILIATILFITASLTDFIDGYLARKNNQITVFGKFLDPLIDKILVISLLVYLVSTQIIPSWMVIVIIAREFAVSGFRIISASEGEVIAANNLGKFKTQSQIIAVIFALLGLPYLYWIMLFSVMLTVLSGGNYIWNGRFLFDKS